MTMRERSYEASRTALTWAIEEAESWSALAAGDATLARESLGAWCRVGRLAVDARHEHEMLLRESPSPERSGPRGQDLHAEETSAQAQ
jgi:hypothetical protein